MSDILLNDGRMLNLSPEQSNRLSMVILLSTDPRKRVKVGDQSFALDQIVVDPEEKQNILQQKLVEVEPQVIHKDIKNRKQLA